MAALSELGARVYCIELTCSTAELEQRLASADRAQFGKVNSVERFRQLSSSGAFPLFTRPAETISVDTAGLSAAEAVVVVDTAVNREQSAA